ncbi:serine/threonine protein kinase [Gordonia sp. HY285]|uniref:serine/threonine-protein kinase n=1 Tax=Gordonia liuliyuniae TaxID=2911517 RepID=UPI001F36FE47|nr:serine/threonine-protein kinase [Gordonia liuliyuniae]MCF8611204.1 serine/threonine protein kinase [Gordonia liuliyuniae]
MTERPAGSGMSPGAEFAGYVIERRLGAGGMGEVYLARHPRLPRHDAIKVLASHLTADPAYRARFEREAELAAGLRHPAIVAVYDRGESDGRLWIAMAYVEGRDLAERLAAEGPLAANQVAFVVSTVGDALDRANQRGLVHRDVKPANILLSDDGDVLLADFGIARSQLPDSSLTATGTAVGTLDFASPEQLQGLAVDGRSDQYSLACTAFALLTGGAPFADSSAARVILRQLNEPLPSVLPRRPDLTQAVDAVLARATAKDPAQRYASASEFAATLSGALAQHPAPQAGPSAPVHQQYSPTVQAPPTLPRPASNRRRLLIAGGVVAVVVALVVGLWVGVPRFLTSEGEYVQEPTDAARALDLPEITPLLPSLETKPTASTWRYQPPGGDQYVRVAGAVGDIVLVGRDGALDIVDAATARLRRTVPIGGDDAPVECGADEKATWAVCRVGYDGSLMFFDLERGVRTASEDMPSSSAAFAVIGNVVVVASGSGESFDVEVLDRRAHRLWSRESTSSVALGGPVVGVTPPKGSGAFAAEEVVAVRVADNKEVARVPVPDDQYSVAPELTPYATGFTLAGHFYDTDGRRLAALPGDWQPMYVAQGTSLTTPAPGLPLLADLDKNIGVVDPETGDVLWSRRLDGAYSAHVTAAGRSALIDNMESDGDADIRPFAWFDVATGAGSSASGYEVYDMLGTDGTRVAVSARDGVRVYGPDQDTPLWTLPVEDGGSSVVSAGGHLYLRGERIV